MVTAALPYPLISGGAIRTYGMLRGLNHAGHELSLLSFHDGETVPAQTPLANCCQRIETMPPPVRTTADRLRDLLLSTAADMEKRLHSDDFSTKLFNLVRESDFDLIQFAGLEVAGYLPILRQEKVRAKLVYDAFNAEASLQHSMYLIDRSSIYRLPGALYSLLQSQRLHRFEAQVCRAADLVIAVSSEDAAILREYRKDGRVSIVPSGIFVEEYAPETSETGELSLERREVKQSVIFPEKTIVFSGKMDYRPNVDAMLWFCNEILPHVPGATLIIVGQQPHIRIQHLTERNNIRLTGYVDSVQPYLRAADVVVAPLRMGSGTRLKILEAMACGCAIVATSLAASGLSPDAKSSMLIADSEMSFADAVNRLLNTVELRKNLGKQARKTVAAYYDWSVIIPRLLDVYRSLQIGTGN